MSMLTPGPLTDEEIEELDQFLLHAEGIVAGGTFPEVVRREPIRNPNKVGRNEPCPCGSGKKFKQCHGSADRLH